MLKSIGFVYLDSVSQLIKVCSLTGGVETYPLKKEDLAVASQVMLQEPEPLYAKLVSHEAVIFIYGNPQRPSYYWQSDSDNEISDAVIEDIQVFVGLESCSRRGDSNDH